MGERIVAGRYAVLAELGRGGMGVVWRAEDRVIGRPVALKELRMPPGLAPGERAVFTERVMREARTAGRLNDPSVVTVHDVVHEGDTVYLVMELVQAPTLADLVAHEGSLPADRVAAIGARAAAALRTAHAAGIVHRDVKPSNIMVLPDDRVKLADFGIAQAMDDPSLTVTGGIMGSPGYLAPELFTGAAPAPASDLWGLGVTLFNAVEGRSPFHRDTTAATMHAVMYDDPRLERCQGPLASVIMGLLARDTGARLTGPQVRELLSSASRPDQSDAATVVAIGDATTRFVDARTSAVPPPPRSTMPRERWHDQFDADVPSYDEPAPTSVPWHADETPTRGPRRRLAVLAAAVALVAVAGLAAAFLLSPDAQSGVASPIRGVSASSSAATTSGSAALSSAARAHAATASGSAVLTATGHSSATPSPQSTSASASRPKVTVSQTTGSQPTQSVNGPGPTPPTTASSTSSRVQLALTRYVNSTGEWHYSRTTKVATSTPTGFTFDTNLGSLVASWESGTKKLFLCQTGSDWYSSIDQAGNCEGNGSPAGMLGYIFDTPQGAASQPLERCKTSPTGGHFDSLSTSCTEGGNSYTAEVLLGYVLP